MIDYIHIIDPILEKVFLVDLFPNLVTNDNCRNAVDSAILMRMTLTANILAILLVLAGSILPDLIFASPLIQPVKLAVLLAATALCLVVKKWQGLWRMAFLLLVINASFWMTAAIRNSTGWTGLFAGAGFFQDVAGAVAVKLIGLVPVTAALLAVVRSPARAYLTPGDFSRKADAIPWLGIPSGTIRWGRLAWISGLLIMLGTVLLAVVTTTGFKPLSGTERLLSSLPLIVLLALANSFCEGVVFRSAILGPVRDRFSKSFALLLPALYFGIAHYQGIPGGPLGAAMSGLLGYYMSRSLYETGGYASAWVIHFLQDVAIFSTLALLG